LPKRRTEDAVPTRLSSAQAKSVAQYLASRGADISDADFREYERLAGVQSPRQAFRNGILEAVVVGVCDPGSKRLRTRDLRKKLTTVGEAALEACAGLLNLRKALDDLPPEAAVRFWALIGENARAELQDFAGRLRSISQDVRILAGVMGTYNQGGRP
jgi:hypothetical protein